MVFSFVWGPKEDVLQSVADVGRVARGCLSNLYSMLSREHRISRKDFPKDFRKGKIFHGKSMNISVFPAVRGRSTATAVVSSKILKTAVERNKAKRIVRAVFSPYMKLFPPAQYVIHIKKEIQALSFSDIKKEIDNFSNLILT